MSNVMSIAASGMQSALRAFGASAAEVTQAALPPQTVQAPAPAVAGTLNAPPAGGDLAAAVVDSLQAANAFRANLAVFRTAQQMSKTLLDTLA
jgi:hypothetical protein